MMPPAWLVSDTARSRAPPVPTDVRIVPVAELVIGPLPRLTTTYDGYAPSLLDSSNTPLFVNGVYRVNVPPVASACSVIVEALAVVSVELIVLLPFAISVP